MPHWWHVAGKKSSWLQSLMAQCVPIDRKSVSWTSVCWCCSFSFAAFVFSGAASHFILMSDMMGFVVTAGAAGAVVVVSSFLSFLLPSFPSCCGLLVVVSGGK